MKHHTKHHRKHHNRQVFQAFITAFITQAVSSFFWFDQSLRSDVYHSYHTICIFPHCLELNGYFHCFTDYEFPAAGKTGTIVYVLPNKCWNSLRLSKKPQVSSLNRSLQQESMIKALHRTLPRKIKIKQPCLVAMRSWSCTKGKRQCSQKITCQNLVQHAQ